jgi:galactose mutarotase-like enzyme
MPDRSLYKSLAVLVVVTASFLLLWEVGCKMKRVHVEQVPMQAPVLLVGGKEPVTATRIQEGTGGSPEFLSMTVLPGRGMNLYQITAYLPGIGVTNLLASPPIEQEAALLNGKGSDTNGEGSALTGGAFLLPFSDPVHGTLSEDGSSITTSWNNHAISLPADTAGNQAGMMAASVNGLALNGAIEDQVDDEQLLDGHQLNATLNGGNFGGHWPSTSEVKYKLQLGPRAIDMTVTVQNTGTEAEPVSVGWMPHFAIPSGQRGQVRLHIPAGERIETSDAKNRVPTGRIVPVTGTAYDFTQHTGTQLNNMSVDEDFTGLKSTVFDMGPTIELMDPAADYGLRMVCRSADIKDIHVYAPGGKNYVVIEPQFSHMDPLNKAWKTGGNGMVMLQPGELVKWEVRLEFYSPVANKSAAPVLSPAETANP